MYLRGRDGKDIADNPVLDPVFLMEQIELREELEEIERTDGPLATLDNFKTEVEKIMASFEEEFAASYSGGDHFKAEQAVYKLQFMNKLLLAANSVEEKLLDY